MKTDEIRHEGFVESVDGSTVRVRILQASACSGCQAKSLCKVSESKEKLIDVDCDDASSFEVGQKVNVAGTTRQGMRAVMLAFTIPLFMLLLVLIASNALGMSDSVAAAASITVLAIYYLVLFFLRKKIKSKFQFKIITE